MEVLVARHLDDIDNLVLYGRDGPLADTEENTAKLEELSNIVCERIIENNRRWILFVSSPRLRASQTAVKIGERVQEHSEGNVRTFYSINQNLHSTDQGDILLPPEYYPGQKFTGLQLASNIFDRETHGSDFGVEDNIDYRFGDPVLRQDGTYKYPELAGHFSRYGETYRETLLRLFGAVLETAGKYERLKSHTELVVVAHGQQFHLFSELAALGEAIQSGALGYYPGASIKLMWEIYKNTDENQKVPGICAPIDFSPLADPYVLSLLRSEIEFLGRSERAC